MAAHGIIVIGASAGGVEALSFIASRLPATLDAAVFMVLHVSPSGHSQLPFIVGRTSALPAFHALDGASIEHGKIYIAPPDHHLLIDEGRMRVSRGPRENRHRPSIDVTFRSAALAYGTQPTGVVLTGYLDDGTAGLQAIKSRDGKTIVQSPEDALIPAMPANALSRVEIDYCLPLVEIPERLVLLAKEPAADQALFPASEAMRKETAIERMDMAELNSPQHVGTPSAYSCPECHGVLWQIEDGELVRFRCRVGHAYSVEAVQSEQQTVIERALWEALKTLEERASLSLQLVEHAQKYNLPTLVERYRRQGADATERAKGLRD